MDKTAIIEADLTWMNEAFEPNVQVVIGPGGTIEQVGFLDQQPTMRLEGEALLPGMVNAHSQAFQRGLRGFGEEYATAGAERGSWLDSLAELVEVLDRDEFRNLSRMAFEEMLRGGITTVGEFHCLHHDSSGEGYAFDQAILEAARDAGIRLVLLPVYQACRTGDRPLTPAEQRCHCGSVRQFRDHIDAMRRRLEGAGPRLGLGAGGFDSVTADELAELAAYALEHRMVLQIPLETRPEEVEDSVARQGATPARLLLDRGLVASNVTVVHATCTSADNLRRIAASGGGVCLCPTTAANRGDGLADLPTMIDSRMRLALGTGGNVRISLCEEMRWLEYGQRLRHQRRGICVDEKGRSANLLWKAATTGGAATLGLPVGRIAPGCLADLFAIDVRGLSLLGSTPESLLPAFVFGAGRACITRTSVGGHWYHWDV